MNLISLCLSVFLPYVSSLALCLRFGSSKICEVINQSLILTSGFILGSIISLGLIGLPITTPYIGTLILFYLVGSIFIFFTSPPRFYLKRFTHVFKSLIPLEILKICLSCIAIAACGVTVILFQGDFPDAYSYHSEPVIGWIQERSLFVEPFDQWRAGKYYPKVGEIFFFWMAIFSNNWLLADLGNMISYLLGASSLYTIARIYSGASRLQALLSVNLFLFTPLVVAQTTNLAVDITLATFFWASISAALYLTRALDLFSVIIFSTSAGLMMGTKYSGLPLTVLSGTLIIFIMILKRNIQEISVKKIFIGLLVSSLTVVLTGGVWYIWNYYRFGNPMEPFEVKILGFPIFTTDQPVDMVKIIDNYLPIKEPGFWGGPYFYSTIHSLFDLGKNPWNSNSSINGGFGPIFTCVALPSLVFGLFKRRRFKPHHIYFLLISALLFTAYCIQPCRWWSRYVLWVIFLPYISVSFFIWSLKKETRNILIITLSLLLLASLIIQPGMSDLKTKVEPHRIVKQLKKGKRSVYGKRYGISNETSYNDWLFKHVCGTKKSVFLFSGHPGTSVCENFNMKLIKRYFTDNEFVNFEMIRNEKPDFIAIDQVSFPLIINRLLPGLLKERLIKNIPYFNPFVQQIIIELQYN
ncbi:MAG: hypothetical protein HUU36_00535 [Candidatus Omnitrophica bacterium]|nr:hypothetical protein [Candidatus Omnitrophota bacterium]